MLNSSMNHHPDQEESLGLQNVKHASLIGASFAKNSDFYVENVGVSKIYVKCQVCHAKFDILAYANSDCDKQASKQSNFDNAKLQRENISEEMLAEEVLIATAAAFCCSSDRHTFVADYKF